MISTIYLDARTVLALVGTGIFMVLFLIICNDAMEKLDSNKSVFISVVLLVIACISSAAIFMLIKTGAI